MAWGQVCRPKKDGGLGVLDLETFNLNLLTKWYQGMLANLGGQLQKLLRLKYGPRRDEWWGETHNASNASSF